MNLIKNKETWHDTSKRLHSSNGLNKFRKYCKLAMYDVCMKGLCALRETVKWQTKSRWAAFTFIFYSAEYLFWITTNKLPLTTRVSIYKNQGASGTWHMPAQIMHLLFQSSTCRKIQWKEMLRYESAHPIPAWSQTGEEGRVKARLVYWLRHTASSF